MWHTVSRAPSWRRTATGAAMMRFFKSFRSESDRSCTQSHQCVKPIIVNGSATGHAGHGADAGMGEPADSGSVACAPTGSDASPAPRVANSRLSARRKGTPSHAGGKMTWSKPSSAPHKTAATHGGEPSPPSERARLRRAVRMRASTEHTPSRRSRSARGSASHTDTPSATAGTATSASTLAPLAVAPRSRPCARDTPRYGMRSHPPPTLRSMRPCQDSMSSTSFGETTGSEPTPFVRTVTM